MSRVAVPLKLGNQGDTHFGISTHWRDHFARMQARSGRAVVHVEDLRRWIDEPEPYGLPAPVANLVVLAYADMTNRSFFEGDDPYADARIDHLPDRLELREQELPDQAAWEAARKRAPRLPILDEAQARAVVSEAWPEGPLPQWVRLVANFPREGLNRVTSIRSAEESTLISASE